MCKRNNVNAPLGYTCTQAAIRFLQQNTKFQSCTQTAIRFFTPKYEILKLYQNGHPFFYSEIRNFKVVPKRPSVFLQRNTKFQSCTQAAIRFFTAKYEILKLYQNGHPFFYSEIRNFKVVPKRPFVFLQ